MTNSQYRRNIGEKGVNDSDSYEKSDKREHKEEKYRETEKKPPPHEVYNLFALEWEFQIDFFFHFENSRF